MLDEYLDLRSDTVTLPTQAMREAMALAPLGDDVYGDDPTVCSLENYAADLLNKEAALLVCSGTMGNQLAILALVQRGEEVILAEQSHIVWHEAGAPAFLAGAQLRCLPADNQGRMKLDQMESTIRKNPQDIHSPRTALLCLENADSQGHILDLAYMKDVYELAKKYEIPVHLDGARLCNAAVGLGIEPGQIARYATTVQLCLSKGLCAPVGSLLIGPKSVIERARQFRKMLGGGMRQAGVLAAPGLIALQQMRLRLHEDHDHARWLAHELQNRPQWFEVLAKPEINMVFFRLRQYPVSQSALPAMLAREKIRINPPDEGIFRLVTHYWTPRTALQRLIDVLDRVGRSQQS